MRVRHLHALGRRGGAGRIDDGAQVGLVHLGDAFVEHAVADRVAVGAQGVQVAVFEASHALHGGAVLFDALALVGHVARLDNDRARIGIIGDVADLLFGIRVIHGGDHAADGEHSRIEHIPFVAGVAHERHGIALLQADVDEALRNATDVGQRLGGGARHPFAVVLVSEKRIVGHARRTVLIQAVDGLVVVDLVHALRGGGEHAGLLADIRCRGVVGRPP